MKVPYGICQIQQLSTAQPMFRPTVSSAPLANVQQFTYLGSILTSDCDITHEVNRRIQLASTAFGRLCHRVFFNHNLSISTKVAVYNAMCVSVLLFGCETWTLYRRHLRALGDYHIKSVQKILGLHWLNKVSHVEIRRRANVHYMEHLVMQRQLRWVGHVIRMQSNRLPRRILYSELQQGQRAAGGQKKRFYDQLKATLRKCSVSQLSWRHWRPIEKSCGRCVTRAWRPSTSTMTRRQTLVELVDTRSQAFLQPVLAAAFVAESVHPILD